MNAGGAGPAAGRAPGTAALVAVAWGASVVAADGVISLLTDHEVVAVPGAGPLTAPVAEALALGALLVRLLLGTPPVGRGALLPIGCAAIVWVVALVAGSALYAAARGEPADALIFAGATALSPFQWVPAGLAALGALVFLLSVRARDLGAGRPRWPWEEPGEP